LVSPSQIGSSTRRRADPTSVEDGGCPRRLSAAGIRSATLPRGEAPGLPGGQRILAGEQPEGDRDLAPASHAELLAEDIAVRLGGPGGDPEPCSYLFVRAPGRNQGDDLTLTRCNRRRFPFRGQLHHGCDAIPPARGRPFLTGCICRCINRSRAGFGLRCRETPVGTRGRPRVWRRHRRRTRARRRRGRLPG
jgi:hypothetical protein